MEPIITIASPADVITLTGTDVEAGWIYDNDALDAWLKLAPVDVKLNKRPNAHGAYDPEQMFTGAHRFAFPGQYYGAPADAAQARNRLNALYANGYPVRVTVADELGTTSRTAFVIESTPEWTPHGHFTFILDFVAPDPRRYADAVEAVTGLPTASSGLVWPLAGATYFNWGTAGNPGRVAFENNGNATTYPILEVGEDGRFTQGFYVTEVETGRELRYESDTLGEVVTLDARTTRARIGSADVTRYLTRREWPEVPAGETRTYQIASLGVTSGTPKLRLVTADAYL